MAVAAASAIVLAIPAPVAAHAGPDELKRAADAAVAQRPDDPQAHLDRARVLRVIREWDAALAELEAADARGGDRDQIGATRAEVLLDAGRPLAALHEIDRVLARRPDGYGLVFDRGRALLALGHTEQAAQAFGTAIKGMPAPRPEHVFARRDALLSLGQREAAVAALDDGMARIGRVATLQLAALDIESELGQYDRALRRVDELLAREGHNPAWIARRGEILERAGRSAEARAEYARALRLIEMHPAARRVRGFDELRRRLRTALASASQGGK